MQWEEEEDEEGPARAGRQERNRVLEEASRSVSEVQACRSARPAGFRCSLPGMAFLGKGWEAGSVPVSKGGRKELEK